MLRESTNYPDALTGKNVTRLTSGRDFNHLPTYHNNTDFTADSRFLVFSSWPKDRRVSYLMKAELATGEITVLATLPGAEKKGRFNGNNMALVQASGWVVSYTYAVVYAYHIDTREEKILAVTNGTSTFGHPAGSLDGKTVYIARQDILPSGAYRYVVLAIDLASLETREIFSEEHFHCNHIQPNPVKADELLITREEELSSAKIPINREFYKNPRMIVLNLKSKQLTEIAPVMSERKWIVHMTWNAFGDQLFYEIKDDGAKKHEIGVAAPDGRPIWHLTIPRAGVAAHVGTHTQKNWMIVEGGVFDGPRRFCFLKLAQRDASGMPTFEDIALHDSDVANYGQESHGHSQVSPDGRYLAFNAAKDGRSDVYVVKLK